MEVNSIVEGFFKSSANNPDKTAIIWGDEKVSYAEVSDNILKVAGFLDKEGVSKGDRVVLFGV
ncbi:unnamed protein product [Chrysoparadoxa australica]